ncbi:MAG: DUF3048 C-terminal domain-containing protein, partial [Patescibacteria group bacterium]
QTITAKNIIFQFAVTKTLDAIGRKAITTRGNGEVWLVQAGQLIKGSWRKDAPGSRTKFFDAAGQPMQFLRGTTWVEVMPADLAVTVRANEDSSTSPQ